MAINSIEKTCFGFRNAKRFKFDFLNTVQNIREVLKNLLNKLRTTPIFYCGIEAIRYPFCGLCPHVLKDGSNLNFHGRAVHIGHDVNRSIAVARFHTSIINFRTGKHFHNLFDETILLDPVLYLYATAGHVLHA